MKFGILSKDDIDYAITVRPGNILVTRNTDEVGNESPGHWNHCAIASHFGWVIEAQKEPDAVIAVPFDCFVERYPNIIALRLRNVDDLVCDAIAKEATKLVGREYRQIASLFPRWRRKDLGENCVSVVRKAVAQVTGKDYHWRRPDHVVKDCHIICGKYDYDGWQKPDVWFEGMTKNKQDLVFEPKVR